MELDVSAPSAPRSKGAARCQRRKILRHACDARLQSALLVIDLQFRGLREQVARLESRDIFSGGISRELMFAHRGMVSLAAKMTLYYRKWWT